MHKTIVVAAGGTGGHLFPAQAFGKEMLELGVDVLFAGGGLATNRYFQKEQFLFHEVSSSTPFRKQLSVKLHAVFSLLKGAFQSVRLLRKTKPDLVVGFGSFHSFPVMLAAVCLRIPLVVFESNAIPGRVNRLFSRWALCSTVQFSLAAPYFSGKVMEVAMPFRKQSIEVDKEQARAYFHLHPTRPTFLVFGGSQGAVAINRLFSEAAILLKQNNPEFSETFQVIHFAGNEKAAEELQEKYRIAGIPACVKPFEKRMDCAWKAADIAICRSGAATLAELVAFEVPALLIPYPYATDDHQKKNALFLEQKVGGALCRDESGLTKERLVEAINELLSPETRATMRKKMHAFKQHENKQTLSTFIFNTLNYP